MSGARTAFDVAVVGGGIVGLGTALAVRRRGLSVVVVERGSEASGASIRNFGHLCITPQSGLAREFALVARQRWIELARDADVWLRESGTLVAARHDDELALLEEFAAARGDEVELLDARQAEERMPLPGGAAIGGAFLPQDLQTDPRQAVAALTAHLSRLGVEFRMRTTVTGVRPGRVETSRGPIDAGSVVVAANHDLDLLFPDLAEQRGIVRCGLDMMRVAIPDLRMPLTAPLLTGWSLVRYSGFATTSAASALRERLHAEQPALAALDLNQMYTQLSDGSVIVGDTHYRGATVAPFQPEIAFEALLEVTRDLFGIEAPRVIERWQGVYASGPDDFLIEEVEPGVHLAAATTGIGMTTGLGLAEHVVSAIADGSATGTASSTATTTTTTITSTTQRGAS